MGISLNSHKWLTDYSKLTPLFHKSFQDSPINALTDLSEFLSLLDNPSKWSEGLDLFSQYLAYAKENNLYASWKNDSANTLKVLEKQSVLFTNAGSDKDDILIGDQAGDTLRGKNGNDVLLGGKGNDSVEGSYGSDTYIFSKGHGQDIIEEWDSNNSGAIDTLRFTDVSYAEVKFRREENNLVLFGYHEDDRVTLRNFYNGSYEKLEHYEFTDRTLSLKEILAEGIRFVGTEGDDNMYDWLDGSGKATYEGGAGNDVLNGSYGADTYLFGNGHGRDAIVEWDSGSMNSGDVIRFSDITDPSKLWFSRKNNSLVISELNTQDNVTIQNWYNNQYTKVEQIQLANGKSLNIAQVEKLVEAMSTFENQYSGDITQAPQNEVQQYMDKLAVSGYWA